MLNVFITVDTEFWPRDPGRWDADLDADFRRDILGITAEGEFGIGYQMDVLDRHGLKGVFLVESLSPCVIGRDRLRAIVGLVLARGHEVQLHAHAEWFRWSSHPVTVGRGGRDMGDFSEDDQARLLAEGIANLEACGAGHPRAFRAGNYGANLDTLRALGRVGIAYDTSHNAAYLGPRWGLEAHGPMLQPTRIGEVYEFPIASFRDWPGHARHAQLSACSIRELECALVGAWARGWHSFVLVSHSFELIRRRLKTGSPPSPDRTVVRRFDRLCRFLATHADKFRTTTFREVDPVLIPTPRDTLPLRSNLPRTVWRCVEQLARRAQ